MERHYAPRVPLHLAATAQPGEVVLGFGAGRSDITLSDTGDLARRPRAFSVLHDAEALAQRTGASAIRVPLCRTRGWAARSTTG
jgi:hypothetical protein